MAEAEGAPAEDEEMEAEPEPTVRKGPTPEQITAIKVGVLPVVMPITYASVWIGGRCVR